MCIKTETEVIIEVGDIGLQSVPKTVLPRGPAPDSASKTAGTEIPCSEEFPLPSVRHESTGNYTGLVIDCSDVNLTPVLSPVIRGNDNQSIYSCDNLAYDKILANGIVGYAMTKNEKKSALVSYTALIEKKFLLLSSANEKIDLSRAGSNPLVIKATSVSDDFTCPVVSDDDADKILAENQASHFLDEGSVVFVSYRVGGVRI